MGKRLEDLNLAPDPSSPTRGGDLRSASTPSDARDTVSYQFLQAIDDLLGTGRYSWAEDTLTGIQQTVERTRVVTEGQRRAVANIEAASERQEGGRRRYEGFSRRR